MRTGFATPERGCGLASCGGSPVRVDPIDARTAPDEQLLAIHRIEAACLPEIVPGEPSRPAAEAVAYYRYPPETSTRHHWLAGEAGFASLYVDSPAAVFLELLVAPEHRRRGVGSALLDTVCAFARARGLHSLIGEHATPGGAAFAARFGGVDGQRNVRALLPLQTAELAAPEPPEGWRLATWLGRVPDEHVESYARARASIDDAPTQDGVQYAAQSVERVRAGEESLRRRERELRVTVALDTQDEIGAFTDLRVSLGSTLAFTDDTATVAAYRGIGLATAVKLESLRRLRDDHAEVTVVTTTNAEENAAMRHVNARIGFVAAATLTSSVVSV